MRLKEIKPGMVIHCKTEEEATSLKNELDKLGYVWISGHDIKDSTIWGRYKEICLLINENKMVTWDYADDSIKAITEFSDLIIPELSAKEVLETMKEICKHHDCQCHRCSFRGNCDPTEYSSDKIIDICTKWREEHPKEEKKELETEWVYVVRIIKVENNGFKKCVYEEDFPALIEKPVVEDVLKHYCSEHDGNFFAALEHICRIKE